MARKGIPAEALLNLRKRLGTLPPRSSERRQIMQETAALYGVAEVTLYRMLREHARPRSLRRADYGLPRVMPKAQMERYCEVIAAIKLRTSNKQGHYLSTDGAHRGLGPSTGFATSRLRWTEPRRTV